MANCGITVRSHFTWGEPYSGSPVVHSITVRRIPFVHMIVNNTDGTVEDCSASQPTALCVCVCTSMIYMCWNVEIGGDHECSRCSAYVYMLRKTQIRYRQISSSTTLSNAKYSSEFVAHNIIYYFINLFSVGGSPSSLVCFQFCVCQSLRRRLWRYVSECVRRDTVVCFCRESKPYLDVWSACTRVCVCVSHSVCIKYTLRIYNVFDIVGFSSFAC